MILQVNSGIRKLLKNNIEGIANNELEGKEEETQNLIKELILKLKTSKKDHCYTQDIARDIEIEIKENVHAFAWEPIGKFDSF